MCQQISDLSTSAISLKNNNLDSFLGEDDGANKQILFFHVADLLPNRPLSRKLSLKERKSITRKWTKLDSVFGSGSEV